jgi:hypothetical protein
MELNGFTLKIEAPPGNVQSMGMFRLMTSGGACVKDGHIVLGLKSVISDYWDGVDERKQPLERAQILKFPKQRARAEREIER